MLPSLLTFALFPLFVLASTSFRTGWQYIRGTTYPINPCASLQIHGDPCEFTAASIPSDNDPAWLDCGPSDSYCLNNEDLSIFGPNGSRLKTACNGRSCPCFANLDFTYFQTFVTVPDGATLTSFTIKFDQMDDGAMITIYNSDYPEGTPPEYESLCGGFGCGPGASLAHFIVVGEINRVVITQVDDCPVGNNIVATVQIDGCDVCIAQDQCHAPGTCNPMTSLCSAGMPLVDGTPCGDGNACTQTDTCTNGVCIGSNPVVCTALDQCHDVGTCAPDTGHCSNPDKGDNTACNDGNACTQTDICTNGVCVGSNPVVCTALDQCHVAGTCDPVIGCSNPNIADNTQCNDHNACSTLAVCQQGVCVQDTSQCCRVGSLCGLCKTNCGNTKNDVRSFFGVPLTTRVNAGVGIDAGGGNKCAGTEVCCIPEEQGVVYVDGNGICVRP